VEYLGKRVVCQHCLGHLIAADPANVRRDPPQASRAILARADELLQSMTPRRPQPR
jgi:hypothetical protein